MNKAILRADIRKLKTCYMAQFPGWSEEICRRLLAKPYWSNVRVLLAYYALPDEPQLRLLLDTARQAGKKVLLPVVDGDDLLIRQYTGEDSLSLGAFGIKEPMGELFPLSRYAEIDLVLVPGMAFDARGHRLGRGRGYYDRLLPKLPAAHKVGICFPFQFVDAVPCESHDIRVDEVLEMPI